jgi:septal ring factor EnvC (AmiA/AmiB activator)
MSASIPPSLETSGQAASVLDEKIEELQAQKLKCEIRQLRGLSFESFAKLSVALVGIFTAGWALWLGLPQAQSDLRDAKNKTEEIKKDLDNKASEIKERDNEISKKVEDLRATESQLLSRGNEYARLQEEIQSLNSQYPADSREARAKLDALTKPTVFVQFAGSLNRNSTINPLLQELDSQGFNTPAAERVNKGQSNEVRFFSDTNNDRKQAEKIARLTSEYFQRLGCPLPSMNAQYVRLAEGRNSPLELWLMHSCPTK